MEKIEFKKFYIYIYIYRKNKENFNLGPVCTRNGSQKFGMKRC